MSTKTCVTCLKEKMLDDFHALKDGKYGRHSKCKQCRNMQRKERYTQNHEKELQWSSDHKKFGAKQERCLPKPYLTDAQREASKKRKCEQSNAAVKRWIERKKANNTYLPYKRKVDATMRDRLTSAYIRQLISRTDKIKTADITQEMVDARRIRVKEKRERRAAKLAQGQI